MNPILFYEYGKSAAESPIGYLSDDNPVKLGYTLRKIDSTYAGDVILAQRHSDDAEQLIGYSGDAIDTESLLTFAGSSTVGVKTLFEGTGKGVNATQTVKTSQPLIVIDGVLVTDNGLPSMDFGTLTTPKHLLFSTDLFSGKNLDLYWVMSCRNYDSIGFVHFSTTNASSYWQITNGGNFYVQNKQGVGASTQHMNDSIPRYLNLYAESTQITRVLNNTTNTVQVTPTAISAGVKTYTIGKYVGGSNWDLDGKISEFIIFDTLQAGKDVIKNNMKSYYGLT
jgi:hypothetical protein